MESPAPWGRPAAQRRDSSAGGSEAWSDHTAHAARNAIVRNPNQAVWVARFAKAPPGIQIRAEDREYATPGPARPTLHSAQQVPGATFRRFLGRAEPDPGGRYQGEPCAPWGRSKSRRRTPNVECTMSRQRISRASSALTHVALAAFASLA